MSSNTLHDFVLNLLSDPTALRAFQADAEGTLADAGLSDISALDVQEVIPLVLDYAPGIAGLPGVAGVPVLDTTFADERSLDVLDGGPVGAISQLLDVTQQLGVAGLPSVSGLNLAAVGLVTADAEGLDAFAGVGGLGLVDGLVSADVAVAGDFSVVNDVTNTLDGAIYTATGTVDGVVDTAGATIDTVHYTASGVTGVLPGTDGVTSTAFGTVDSLHGVVDNVTGGVTSGLTEGWGVDHTLDVAGLGQTGSSDVALSGSNPVGGVVDTTTGIVQDSGVGGVVSNVTEVTDVTQVAGVDVDGTMDLLF